MGVHMRAGAKGRSVQHNVLGVIAVTMSAFRALGGRSDRANMWHVRLQLLLWRVRYRLPHCGSGGGRGGAEGRCRQPSSNPYFPP